MRLRRKHLIALFVFLSICGGSWYYFLYPDELWIKYNFVVRSSEIDSIAEYVENQDQFSDFTCIEDDVRLDKKAAPESIHEELQGLCLSSRLDKGRKTDDGSSFHLGNSRKWQNIYWVFVVHDPKSDAGPNCKRWRKPSPAEGCLVKISDDWAIYYWNATFQNEDLQEFAEDVAKGLSEEK